jgi:hypothetical protein
LCNSAFFEKIEIPHSPSLKPLLLTILESSLDRAIAQAVSRWLPTAAAWVRAQSGHVGFVVEKVALGQVFSKYFGSPAGSYSTECSTLIIIYHPELVR